MINKIKNWILKWAGKALPVAGDIFIVTGSVTLGVGIGSFLTGGVGIGQMVIGLALYTFGCSLWSIQDLLIRRGHFEEVVQEAYQEFLKKGEV